MLIFLPYILFYIANFIMLLEEILSFFPVLFAFCFIMTYATFDRDVVFEAELGK